MGGAEFIGLVEAIRAFGVLAIGIHVVYLYVIPGMLAMMACHLAAFFLEGRAQRFLRGAAFTLSCIIGLTFLILAFIDLTLKGGLILLCSGYMCARTIGLLRAGRAGTD